MASETRPLMPPAADTGVAAVADLLGGRRRLGSSALDSPVALHDRLVRGLPATALRRFARRFPLLAKDPAFVRLLAPAAAPHAGRQSAPGGRLSSQESGQLWRIAVLLVRAAPLLGETEAAGRWLVTPAIGLGGRRPLELLETPVGCELVADYLIQLEFCVYV